MNEYSIVTTKSSKDYELLDSGEGEKLERYGNVVLSRPDPQALWPKQLSLKEWMQADAIFAREGKNAGWQFKKDIPTRWPIEFGPAPAGLKFWIKPSVFKHTGLFPEQLANWEWMQSLIQARVRSGSKSVPVLNLFGYTGGATLACAAAGAEVCHVDGSKTAIAWARDNAELSGLKDKPIRWILDDATAFVRREIKRGRQYDGIIMDPPAFGHGPKGEMWKIEEQLLPFLNLCCEVLSGQPLFFLINGYASGYSAVAYGNNITHLFSGSGGSVEMGELTIAERSGRLLPCGIFSRWSNI